ncbi:hypothetical protein M413DRAFT_95490 [Hebeloma cylindrosporum]|uniref:Uncharacterized protein n=1 Tax=Hebeloma cylindrosporum TaxID=76867 RepID=A0A0C3CK39_HEBCY|nr:hypothetical protein M413DRAFT_95490 [Hebeloma cylindrosporum h7]
MEENASSLVSTSSSHVLLLIRWMHTVFERGVIDKPLPSIHRLFMQENEPLQLSPIVGDSVNQYLPYSQSADPLGAVLEFARESESSISQALLYLTMIVKSGVNISTPTFTRFFTIVASNKLDGLPDANILIRSIILSLWQRSLGRQDLQSLIASIHGHFSPLISQSLVSGENFLVALSIIRQSLAACLLICGCERASILAAGMVDINEIQDLPSRRKVTVRGSTLEDPIIIQPEILTALQLYLQSSLDDVSCLVAKFFNLFLVESPFLESFEIDNFILRNGKLIALCIWTTYGIQQEDLGVIRTNLFLRSIVVDSEPLQEIVQGCLDPASNCIQQRLSGLNRLFHIISDVTSPAFNVEGRQWRSSVTCIFHFYFSSLWADPSVRISVLKPTAFLPRSIGGNQNGC